MTAAFEYYFFHFAHYLIFNQTRVQVREGGGGGGEGEEEGAEEEEEEGVEEEEEVE